MARNTFQFAQSRGGRWVLWDWGTDFVEAGNLDLVEGKCRFQVRVDLHDGVQDSSGWLWAEPGGMGLVVRVPSEVDLS